jgi:pyridoxine 4-dehydrogenase
MTTPGQPAKASGEFSIGGGLPVTRLGDGAMPPKPGTRLAEIADKRGASPSQLALAWLLRRSPVMLPIPGTSSVAHLEDNVAAAGLELTDGEYAELADAAR